MENPRAGSLAGQQGRHGHGTRQRHDEHVGTQPPDARWQHVPVSLKFFVGRSVAAAEAGERLPVDVAELVADWVAVLPDASRTSALASAAEHVRSMPLGPRQRNSALDRAGEETLVRVGAGCAVNGTIAAQSATRPTANAAAMMN